MEPHKNGGRPLTDSNIARATEAAHAWPDVVDRASWLEARAKLLPEEKALTRESDRVNALRRRLPMTEVRADYLFADPQGEHTFEDLFEGRTQLVIYHNMLTADDEWICRGCSQFSDALGGLAYLKARDTSFVMESAARVSEIEAVKARFGWTFPWMSSHGTTFRQDFALSAGFLSPLTAFVRREGRIYQTYITGGRGVEYASNPHRLLDLTAFGRSESFEDSPVGWPQVPTHSWERLPDEF
jgi:predicted dithiol-disulfide oxidoreductase (DUF899 family)